MLGTCLAATKHKTSVAEGVVYLQERLAYTLSTMALTARQEMKNLKLPHLVLYVLYVRARHGNLINNKNCLLSLL